MRTLSFLLVVALGLAGSVLIENPHAQERNGRLEGRLARRDTSGVSGATAILNETGETMLTGADGQFWFANLTPGTYSVTLSLGPQAVTITGVQISAGATETLEETVDWEVGFTYELVVRGVSRQAERIVEAPAAATSLLAADIERMAPTSEAPKLLEFAPGAMIARGGLWDFNIGTRGFNRALSRRVAVMLDGHDLSLPFFGYQGWPAFSFPLDDLANVELVRGPSAALYGANASGGVIHMTSKEPKLNRGGMLRATFGGSRTMNIEGRWAGSLGNNWYARAVGGMRRSAGFAVSRVNGPEYSVTCAPGTFGDCLPTEVVSFDDEDAAIVFGQLRFDKYFSNDVLLTMEVGHAQGAFGVFQAVAQRAKSVGNDGKRPWARLNISTKQYNVAAIYDGYHEPSGYVGLTSGNPFNSNSHRVQVDGQTNRRFRQDRIQLVAGGTATIENMDSYNPAVGGQTFLFTPISSNSEAVFAHVGWKVTPRVKAVVAARGDWSSLYDFQLSPRFSVTYAVTPNHSIRGTYNRAFQVSNSLEYFLNAPVAPPVDLVAFNAFCAPFGVDCRFGATPVLALGNEDLDVETVHTFEVGYKGIFVNRALMTFDYYRSRSSNLVTSLLPQIGTSLGRLNPRFGPWTAPAGLPEVVADQIRTLVPLLSNHYDGSNILSAASYTNFDQADTHGIDLGLSWFLPSGWRPTLAYSWFSFSVPKGPPDTQGLLLPNTPSHTWSAGLAYEGRRFGASFDARWVDGFRWSDGFFLGDVESYSTVDMAATYPLTPHIRVNLNVSNVFNDRHWETFGGALLKRRALVGVQYNW
jgi:outer membrane receptor for ferrienterochelin and colicins